MLQAVSAKCSSALEGAWTAAMRPFFSQIASYDKRKEDLAFRCVFTLADFNGLMELAREGRRAPSHPAISRSRESHRDY